MNPKISNYNYSQSLNDQLICDVLALEINLHLPETENKIWHAQPVWFLESKKQEYD